MNNNQKRIYVEKMKHIYSYKVESGEVAEVK